MPQGTAEPNDQDKRYGARIVELYRCTTCNNITRFARYKYHHHDIDENSLLIDITLVMLESYWRHVVEDVVNGQM